MAAAVKSPFDAAYARGITDELPPPTRRGRALPPAPFALHGGVITPEGAWSSGYVTVAGGEVTRVSRRKPSDVSVVETDGVILPGLLDLHGHPEFNVFAAWEPPKLYANRYAWRRSKPYQALVRDPQNTLLAQLPAQDPDPVRRGARAGRWGHRHPGRVGCEHRASEPLVRNVDQWAFGAHRARSMVDLPSGRSGCRASRPS